MQVGSHYHFIETNPELCFNRIESYGFRLNRPAGTSLRFEPGQCRFVHLVEIAGQQVIAGGNGIAPGKVNLAQNEAKIRRQLVKNPKFQFKHTDEPTRLPDDFRGQKKPCEMPRGEYLSMYGPTENDVVRLGLTNLWVMVEKDCRADSDGKYYGDECNFGGGKTIRDGMGQTSYGTSPDPPTMPTNPVPPPPYVAKDYPKQPKGPYKCADTVITNILIIDYSGIKKADIGITHGYISGIGLAGNPDTMNNVHKGIIIGANTDVIAGENKIVTAGGIDTHVHLLDPAIVPEALCNGLTTLVGGGTGPSTGSNATTCTPGPENIKRMMQALDHLPINVGITGKGNNSDKPGLVEQIKAGAIGLKLHEDWGATHTTIAKCLAVCDEYDVQCTIHTDTMNECGFVEKTMDSIGEKTIHTYHTEGAGGGHAPDIIKVVENKYVLPASTNPTRPYTINTVDEHLDMVMVAHHLKKEISTDVAFAESRIRAETIAAEDWLHDTGAISIMSSDSQAMGRVGEVVLRTWNTAHKMMEIRGQSKEDQDKAWKRPQGLDDDIVINNERVKRYISKYTINPAIAHGMSHLIGSVEEGKLADLVLWTPSNFGTKPSLVLKSGMVVMSLAVCVPLYPFHLDKKWNFSLFIG